MESGMGCKFWLLGVHAKRSDVDGILSVESEEGASTAH